MNKEKLIEENIDKLFEYLHSSVDFVKEQAPDVVRQLLEYEAFSYQLWVIVFIVLTAMFLIFSLYLFVRGASQAAGEWDEKSGEWIGWSVTFAVIAIIPAVCCVRAYLNLKQIEMAPKVYLIDYIKKY